MKNLSVIYFTVVGMLLSQLSFGQIDVGNKVKNATQSRADQRTSEGIEEGLNKVEDGVKNLFKKKKEKPQTTPDQTAVEQKNESPDVLRQQNSGNASLQSYSKFDFIPGEKVVFFDNFAQDEVGDFPALWNTNASAEVVTTSLYPGKWMRFVCRDAIWTDNLLTLPDNYTIEFDVIPIEGEEGGMGGYVFRLIKCINVKSYDAGAIPGKGGFQYHVEYFGRSNYRCYTNNDDGPGAEISGYKDDEKLYQKQNQMYHISIWVQKSRLRLYMNETKLFDLPKAFPEASTKMDRLRFEEGAAMISNVRIAVGQPDMRNKLITEGKLVTYGIYFDVNKDVVKPESYGTLKEIAQILNENPGVRVKIIGHTDNDGDDAFNLDLSKRRGSSVKNELIKSFGIDASRLESDGAGERQPISPNDTPANKALNRRVELVKL